jgi:hypothetical protein
MVTKIAATDMEVSVVAGGALLAIAAMLFRPSKPQKSHAPVPHRSPLTGDPGAATPPQEGLTAHPQPHRQPGLVPPSPGQNPGEGGLVPAAPPQQPPGRPVKANQAVILPGPDATAEGATIFEQQRNQDLEPALRPSVPRARAHAALATPDAAGILDPSEWSAHHLIGIANIRRFHILFEAAAKAGWTADEIENMIALPTSPEAQQKLKDHGINLPIHRGPHPDTRDKLDKQLELIADRLKKSDLDKGSAAYSEYAKQIIRNLEKQLRDDMLRKLKIGSNSGKMSLPYA